MDTDLVQSLKDIQLENSHWVQDPKLSHDGVSISLCHFIGTVGATSSVPTNPPNQPEFPPKFSRYRFDHNQYNGIDSAPDMEKLVRSMCPGCKLFKQKDGVVHKKGFLTWQFNCNRYNCMNEEQNQLNFKDGSFTKNGVKGVTVKQKKGTKDNNLFHRLSNSKLKPVKKGNKAKKISDRRGQKTVSDKDKKQPSTKNRTLGGRAPTKDKRCFMNVRIDMSLFDGSWYFNSSSNFNHSYHGEDDPDISLLNESDLNDQQSNMMRLMFEQGIKDQTIANIMSSVLNKDGKPGEFLASTIRNINEKTQKAMDAIAGISADYSIAQKTMANLHE